MAVLVSHQHDADLTESRPQHAHLLKLHCTTKMRPTNAEMTTS